MYASACVLHVMPNSACPNCACARRFQSDSGVRCLASRHTLCQEVEGGGAGLCLRYDSSDISDSAGEPGILYGPGKPVQGYSHTTAVIPICCDTYML